MFVCLIERVLDSLQQIPHALFLRSHNDGPDMQNVNKIDSLVS